MTMKALAKLTNRLFRRRGDASACLREPEPINGKPRDMTGLFAGLSPSQKEAALSYRGPENHGDPAFRLGRHAVKG
ncbi:hypothetical protein MPC4_340026 [Methylocella tundrae]|uniref:Uncharacterized protein n=1 Tax=Methylocella tundrae TaxID=227605 RepID=A0A8B6M8P2_METTU|nr:hypothetical protein MPC1_8140005 [Methylocella tundrae]VTZ51270.1 hypothetical protein MPC4_340026 [Methylocella tundrae]